MTMAVLQDLATQTLPARVSGEAAVEAIRILELAGHIRASITPTTSARPEHQAAARVLAITSQGYRMLRHFRR